MSIILSRFQTLLDFLSERDDHAWIKDVGIFECTDHILVSIQWYDDSEESSKFFFSEKEFPEAVKIARESGWNFWSIDRTMLTLPF